MIADITIFWQGEEGEDEHTMEKLIDAKKAKEFAETFLNDIFLRAAVNAVLDAAPGINLVRCKNCIHSRDFDGRLYCNIWGGTNDVGAEGFCNYGYEKETA